MVGKSRGFSSPAVRAVRGRLLPLVGWGGVVWAQKLRCAAGDVWFTHFPFMGNELQFVLLMPFLAWFADADGHVVRQFALVTGVSSYFNNGAKDMLCLPRPPRALHVGATDGHDHIAQQYGFPSTHSIHALCMACVLAREGAASGWASPTVCWGVAAAHVAHICFSRLYMGVHAAIDIAGGLAIGAALIAVYAAAGDAIDEASVASGWGQLATAAVSIAMLSVYPDPSAENTAFTEVVSFAGLHLGTTLSTGPAAMHFTPKMVAVPHAAVAVPFVAGLIGLGIFRELLSLLSKAIVRELPRPARASGGVTCPAVARHLIVNAMTASLILTLHPTHVARWARGAVVHYGGGL